MLQTVKVLIAGDDEESCWLLRLVLQQDPKLTVVGHARDGRELSALLAELVPDLVLIEMDSPGQGLAAALKMAKLQGQDTGFIGLGGDGRPDQVLLGEVDALVDKRGPLDNLPAVLLNAVAVKNRSPHPPPEEGDTSTVHFSQLLSLYISNLERSHRELEERVNLVQFWLQGTETGGMIQIEKAAAEIVSTVTRERIVHPSYLLSVDGFFNAQHKVSVGGNEGALHPHSWRVNVKLRQESLGEDHLLLGFADAKRILRGELSWLDGKVLNSLPQFSETPPTTENVAALLYGNLKSALRETDASVDSVTVWETPVNSVTYSEG